MPTVPVVRQASAAEATTFFSLPRELRDKIYHDLLFTTGVYTQLYAEPYRSRGSDLVDGEPFFPLSHLAILRASRRLWEEACEILLKENLFRFTVGYKKYDTTFLERKTTDLMQDIAITLYFPETAESVRVLQLFGGSQILRKSCLIRVFFNRAESSNIDIIDPLKQMTGFKVVTLQIDVITALGAKHPKPHDLGARNAWLSGLFARIETELTQTLGPSVATNDLNWRRFIFKPLVHEET